MTEETTLPNKESIEEFLKSFRLASERKRLQLLNVLEQRLDLNMLHQIWKKIIQSWEVKKVVAIHILNTY